MNIMSLLYFIQVFVDDTDTSVTLWIVSIISPTGFALAMDKILVLDISGQGVTLNNLWSGPGIPIGGSILMMAVDIVLYAALAFYLDSVIPGKYNNFFFVQPPSIRMLIFFLQVIMVLENIFASVLAENIGVTVKYQKFHY